MNILEILKQVPEGTKLYSPIFGEVKFKCISPRLQWIVVEVMFNGRQEFFYSDGRFEKSGECMLFPAKGENWENFQIPFKDGDIIIMTKPIRPEWVPNIAIFKEYDKTNKNNPIRIYCQINGDNKFVATEMNVSGFNPNWRKANQYEVAGFIKEMHEAGYQFVDNKVIKLVTPKFKVGDVIANNKLTFRIDAISNEHYIEQHGDICTHKLAITEQDKWKLKKFDRTTLKPYDKVLVKHFEDGCWVPTLVSYVNSSGVVYTLDSDDGLEQVIPFEGHEHLLTSYDDPEPYYITWKED